MSTSADPRTFLPGSLQSLRKVVAGIRPEQLNRPTPCDRYDVAGLVGHLDLALARFAQAGDAVPIAQWRMDETPSDQSTWLNTFDQRVAEIEAAWLDPSKLERETALPWATVPGAAVVVMYLSELLTHGWDLAVATGQRMAADDAAVETALVGMHAALPAEGRQATLAATIEEMGTREDEEVPFADAVTVDADSTALERLVAFCGRDPERWRS